MGEKDTIRAELARRELARRHYSDYLAYVHGDSWKRTRLSEYLAEQVQEFLFCDTGHAYDILVVATPPQHGKSMTISETLPSWFLMQKPQSRVILASYNDASAERFCRRNAEKLRRFGRGLAGVSLGKVDRAAEFELSNGVGRMISRGLMSGITGNPAELVIIDDPIKNREEADSAVIRDKLWNEWQNSIKSRLAAGAKVIVIMTPWHEDDLRGRLLESEEHVRYLRLPVEAEARDPLGRTEGAALCPELGKGDKWLREFRRSYLRDPKGGSRAWWALYMCAPRTEKGGLVKREWWRYYDPKQSIGFATELISVDCAFKGTANSDFVAITVWGKRGNDYYLRYCLNRQLSFSETLRALRATAQLYPQARRVLVEDKANGSAVIDVLGREMFCIAVDPRGGKEARVNAVSPAIESGHVYLPQGEAWLEAYVEQWTAFPTAAHDDMVDSSTQALSYLLFASGGTETSRGPGGSDEGALMDSERLFDVYG